MAPQDTSFSEFDNLPKIFNYLPNGDLASNQFPNTYLDHSYEKPYYTETYEEFIIPKISQTSTINIPQLFLLNAKDYAEDPTLEFFCNSVKLATEMLFKTLKYIYVLNNYFKDLNPRLNNSEDYLQQALNRANILWKNFDSEIIIEAAAKASDSQLTITDIICLMEKNNHTLTEIELILDFIQKVRIIASDWSWLSNMRDYREETEELLVGLNFDEFSIIEDIDDNM